MTDPRDTPLRRWSRLKRDRQAPTSQPHDPLPEASLQRPNDLPAPATGGSDPSNTTAHADEDVQLPDIDSLDKDSDFTVFLTEKVPEELRRRALRSLWRSDPILANLDGLNDYDEDYSTVGTVRDVVRTVYEAGKGYLTEEQRAETEEHIDVTADNNEIEPQTGPDEPAGAQVGDQSARVESLDDNNDTCTPGEEIKSPSN